jgi:hypothetical protein
MTINMRVEAKARLASILELRRRASSLFTCCSLTLAVSFNCAIGNQMQLANY